MRLFGVQFLLCVLFFLKFFENVFVFVFFFKKKKIVFAQKYVDLHG